MKCDKSDLLLYAVTDRSWLLGESLCEQVEKALKGGATFIQLREKELEEEQFLEEAVQIKELCRKYKVPFVINDNVALAEKIGADGVHVGQDDMEALHARQKLGADKMIGVSAHNVEEARRAEAQGADYLGVGAVFKTSSKADVEELDHEVLKEICAAVKIPVIAIGGIGQSNIMRLKGTGICGVAVISAIFAEKDIEKATARMRKLAEQMVGGAE